MEQNQEIINSESLIGRLSARERAIECVGVSGAEISYLVSRVMRQLHRPTLIITPSEKDGKRILADLQFFIGNQHIPLLYFSPYHLLPFKYLAYHSEIAATRINVLYQLLANESPAVIVTTIDALLQKIIPKDQLSDYAELIVAEEEIARDVLISKLISGGYIRTALVEEPGDFSVRGGILDIFSPFYPDPLRIEFFGDFVDSLRFFSTASQRKIKDITEAIILPAREIVLNQGCLPQIMHRIRNRASELDVPVVQVRKIIEHLKNSEGFPGMDGLIPLIYPEPGSFFDYAPQDTLYITIEPGEMEKAAAEAEAKAVANYNATKDAQNLCVRPDELYLRWSEIEETVAAKKPLSLKLLDVVKQTETQVDSPIHLKAVLESNTELSTQLNNSRSSGNLLKPLSDWIQSRRQEGFVSMIICRTRAQADRLESLLRPYGVQFDFADSFPKKHPNAGSVLLCLGGMSSGFVWPSESLAMITEDEIFGVKHQRKRGGRAKDRMRLFDLQELKKEDLIVHIEHGIGQYEGLAKLSIDDITNDFLVLVYKDGDKLYLPVDRMSMVQKYMGVHGATPVLDKMGGKSWERVKARVKKSAEKMAGELLRLYAHRKVEKGPVFNAPDSYFRDFEAGFVYEETADQLKAIHDVLEDMQQSTPMDRLVCGDVGYGKTEVALRAAFLTVNNAKQAAVLVPTTILAEQHYTTFCTRFERYPVKIACLSRFRTRKEQREIVEELKSGKIDIVIGTHRLLQKDIVFKDLGLLVLDEEQRFGVKHKEKLKKLRSAVDVLALTATPIPRTLHMSLTGIRDISLISTPPEFRKSIITYISEFDDAIISDAIRKELSRKGQIFFVHNNIHSIDKYARKLQTLVPEVKLAVAHGRMAESELEEIMLQFMNREIELLVCTTIIESGLDIPSANTIIVNRADRFGLAQMYQLRGRVGRADEQAYAYLLIPDESFLSKDAQKRLKVLMEHSDLGSGFQIAMSDLTIRGGGTILGASQSGHIAAVGYDMFLKLMESAVSELKGERVAEPLDPEINVNLSAFISEAYITDIDQRMLTYRRLARMTDLQEIVDIKAELSDRYGLMPEEASNLLLKIMLKVMARKAGVSKLDLNGRKLTLHFSEAHQQNPSGMIDMIVADPSRFELTPEHVLKALLPANRNSGELAATKNILKEIALRVNN